MSKNHLIPTNVCTPTIRYYNIFVFAHDGMRSGISSEGRCQVKYAEVPPVASGKLHALRALWCSCGLMIVFIVLYLCLGYIYTFYTSTVDYRTALIYNQLFYSSRSECFLSLFIFFFSVAN